MVQLKNDDEYDKGMKMNEVRKNDTPRRENLSKDIILE